MPLTYARQCPQEKAGEMAAHVRAHLSAVASEDDDPDRYAAEVDIVATAQDGGLLIVGTLNREPNAPYLKPGFDPEQDVAANPLSVRSIEEGS